MGQMKYCQPSAEDRRTVGAWDRWVGLSLPPMNRRAGANNVPWSGGCGQVRGQSQAPTPAGPLTWQPQHLEAVVQAFCEVLASLTGCPSGSRERGEFRKAL